MFSRYYSHIDVRCSCLHTTVASLSSQLSSQTVPHAPSLHTSTLPSLLLLPPTSLISLVQATYNTGEHCHYYKPEREINIIAVTSKLFQLCTKTRHTKPVYQTHVFRLGVGLLMLIFTHTTMYIHSTVKLTMSNSEK